MNLSTLDMYHFSNLVHVWGTCTFALFVKNILVFLYEVDTNYNVCVCVCVIGLTFNYTAAYRAEKVSPALRESRPPAYSFGLKTDLLQTKSRSSPSPNSYCLPSLLGSAIVGKKSNPSYSMTGRSKIGSFHEDLKKVLRGKYLLKKVVGFTNHDTVIMYTHYLHVVSLLYITIM